MKAIPKRNPRRIAKRKVAYRKMLAGKEYQMARAEAMERADGRCEYETFVRYPIYAPAGWQSAWRDAPCRCLETEGLHAHHLRYPKSRPLTASDLKILCREHHATAEGLKMHKTRMF